MKLRGWMAALLVLACAAPPGLGRPRVYAQYNNSLDEHCKYNPELCVGAFGPEGGAAGAATVAPAATAAAAPAGVDAIVAIGAGVLAASIVATVKLNPDEQARIEDVLKLCADKAYSDVLKDKFGGKNPSVEQCNERVRLTPRGEPIYLAMALGEEMHQATYRCLNVKLRELIPGRYSIEQRYRYNPRTGRTTVVTKEDEAWLRQHGAGDELRDSIVPDLIIHKGDPRHVQAVYDFKFPCAKRDVPSWRQYLDGHPVTRFPSPTQKQVYEAILRAIVQRVVPGKGAIP